VDQQQLSVALGGGGQGLHRERERDRERGRGRRRNRESLKRRRMVSRDQMLFRPARGFPLRRNARRVSNRETRKGSWR
jgi:hypothetical protein